MSASFLNHIARQFYDKGLCYLSSNYLENDLNKSALVFSPHFDDETLGCGGTIIKKKRAGADVKIVFMTDGSKSHKDYMSQDELKIIRTKEGMAASNALGLNDRSIYLLNFEERKLQENITDVTHKVSEIIIQNQPDEIFIPYYYEHNDDHHATNRAVISAIQKIGKNIIIYEFPIWFWRFWPYFYEPINTSRSFLSVSKRSILSGFLLLRDFRYLVYVGDVLGAKRTALDQHKSQMTKLIPNSDWPTLVNYKNGEFLALFFQKYEIFHKRLLF
jgi:LmbE family N-acetylglucosaminyl deacetylase